MRQLALAVVLAVGASACAGSLMGGLYVRGPIAYRVAEPPAGEWRRVGFDDNDLAWMNSATGQVLAVNAVCEGHEDPSLEVLTTHLLIGFTDRQLVKRTSFELDGRQALRSIYTAKIDGVGRHLDLVVLKKNGCVHDFTYISPEGREGTHQAVFDALLAGFKQERAP